MRIAVCFPIHGRSNVFVTVQFTAHASGANVTREPQVYRRLQHASTPRPPTLRPQPSSATMTASHGAVLFRFACFHTCSFFGGVCYRAATVVTATMKRKPTVVAATTTSWKQPRGLGLWLRTRRSRSRWKGCATDCKRRPRCVTQDASSHPPVPFSIVHTRTALLTRARMGSARLCWLLV